MKTLFTALVILSASCSFAREGQMLTQKEFKTMSRADQVRYLKNIQNIFVNMASKNPYMAEHMTDKDRWPANLPPTDASGDLNEGEHEGIFGGEDAQIGRGAVAKPVKSNQVAAAPLPGPAAAASTPGSAASAPAQRASSPAVTASAPATAASASPPSASAPASSASTPASPASQVAGSASSPSNSASSPAASASAPDSSASSPAQPLPARDGISKEDRESLVDQTPEEKLAESVRRAEKKKVSTGVAEIRNANGSIQELVDVDAKEKQYRDSFPNGNPKKSKPASARENAASSPESSASNPSNESSSADSSATANNETRRSSAKAGTANQNSKTTPPNKTAPSSSTAATTNSNSSSSSSSNAPSTSTAAAAAAPPAATSSAPSHGKISAASTTPSGASPSTPSAAATSNPTPAPTQNLASSGQRKAQEPKKTGAQNQTSSQAQASTQASDRGTATAAKASKANSTSQVLGPDKKPIQGKGETFRCMYAGWVIEKNPCEGYTKIPKWLALGMKEENTSCKDKDDRVCNPMIFGLQLPEGCKNFLDCQYEAKAICVRKGQNPTWLCRQQAQLNQSLATHVAAELISEVVPDQYERYLSMFADLCGTREQIAQNKFVKSRKNPEAALKDIDMTCREAERQIADLNRAFEEKYVKNSEAGNKGKQSNSQQKPPSKEGANTSSSK